MSFLFLFLGVKVGHSIGTESVETGPVEISFLFSFSGFRYIHNHVRHHLFETPLLPRRRFSSLSVSWFSEIIKRASFSARGTDIFADEDGNTVIPEKIRRSSTSVDSHGSRRSSVASKSKRLSVPHINSNRNNISSVPPSPPQTSPEKKNGVPKVISRRNTLPNISLNSEPSKTYIEGRADVHEIATVPQVRIDLIQSSMISNSLNTIAEEEHTEELESQMIESEEISTNIPLIHNVDKEENNDVVNNSDECESVFGDIITEESDISSISEDEPETDEEVMTEDESQNKNLPTEAINIVKKSSVSNQAQTDQISEQPSSPKPSSFRSSYFNYLPESIFGYSTGLNKTNNDSNSAPPGFTKRSASHDFSNSNSTSTSNHPNEPFNNHQPLYARRRTETSHILPDTSKSFFSFDLTSKFQAISNSFSEISTALPIRSNTASPCLSDLQNTEDLFAPINWNFSNSDQTDSLRKSWESIEEENDEAIMHNRNVKTSESKRRPSTTFSSLFDGY